jgi:alkaline phosphatase D
MFRLSFRTSFSVMFGWGMFVGPVALLQAQLFLGSGVKVGEVDDDSAIVLVRLTAAPGQDAAGLIPGKAGQARVEYGIGETFASSRTTGWETAKAEVDHSIQFHLSGLVPAQRYFYRVAWREAEGMPEQVSEIFSWVTSPAPDQRLPVFFHLTTCQDTRGEATYRAMAKQQPDFCVSAGDTVYYDGEGLARNVPQAWEAYQKMFGLPAMKDYYRQVSGYFMKDDHDYRFNDADPYMKGMWVNAKKADPGARFAETQGNRALDVAWLTHEEGIRVFKQVFPMGEKTYRTVRWGKGVQLWMLEHRDYRSPNAMADGPEKSIWGPEQKAWLRETLAASDADYRLIVAPNPIIGPDRIMKGDNHANLNGFWHEAQNFLDWLKENQFDNVILMCGDRHWQYHSTDRRQGRSIHEFSCGPTCDEHVQPVPPMYDGVERPYSASRGGFLAVRYLPDDRRLTFEFYSTAGEALYSKVFIR